MQERKPGCICELDPKTGEPIDPHYGECIVHKPDAPDPKDTANQLIKKHYGLVAYEVMEPKRREMAYDTAKQSASVTVDEILNVLDTFKRMDYGHVLIPFYKEVRDEIKKL